MSLSLMHVSLYNLFTSSCCVPAASGALVISAYAVCPDITATVTPDLQDPDGKGVFLSHTHNKFPS